MNLNLSELRPCIRENGSMIAEPSFSELPPPGPALDAYFKQSNVPATKSIKKILYSNPGLLYYLPEIAFLYYRLLNRNLDFLRGLLQSDNALRCLNLMHVYDSYRFREALEMYARLAGAKRVVHHLAPNVSEPYSIQSLFHNLLRCASMERPMAQRVFRSADCFESTIYNEFFGVDVPVTYYSEIPDMRKDGFVICQQKTSYEIRLLGIALGNCLSERCIQSHPIFGIYEEDKGIPIGAFQLKRRKNGKYFLVQAHAACNTKLPRPAVKAMHSYLDQYAPGWRDREYHSTLLDRMIEQLVTDFDAEDRFPILDER